MGGIKPTYHGEVVHEALAEGAVLLPGNGPVDEILRGPLSAPEQRRVERAAVVVGGVEDEDGGEHGVRHEDVEGQAGHDQHYLVTEMILVLLFGLSC